MMNAETLDTIDILSKAHDTLDYLLKANCHPALMAPVLAAALAANCCEMSGTLANSKNGMVIIKDMLDRYFNLCCAEGFGRSKDDA